MLVEILTDPIVAEAMTDPVTTNSVAELLEQYGLTGLAFGALLTIMLRQNKNAQTRINDLEKAQRGIYEKNIETHKEMIEAYVDLVKQKIKVLADLTGCLNAIKDTLSRMERNKDGS